MAKRGIAALLLGLALVACGGGGDDDTADDGGGTTTITAAAVAIEPGPVETTTPQPAAAPAPGPVWPTTSVFAAPTSPPSGMRLAVAEYHFDDSGPVTTELARLAYRTGDLGACRGHGELEIRVSSGGGSGRQPPPELEQTNGMCAGEGGTRNDPQWVGNWDGDGFQFFVTGTNVDAAVVSAFAQSLRTVPRADWFALARTAPDRQSNVAELSPSVR